MSARPTAKVGVGASAGAVTVILVWVGSLAGVEVPGDVAAAVTLLITAAAAYFMPDKS